MSDYVSDQLRAEASRLRNSIAAPPPRLFGWSPPRMSAQEAAEAKATRKADAEQAQAAALAEWEQLRERIPGTQEGLTLRALLDTHKPYLGEYSYRVECEHCLEGSYDVEQAEWPCESYAIVKEGMG